jgi:hypothetical protein
MTEGTYPDRPKHGMAGCREMVECLNQKFGGWAYLNLGPVTPAYRFIDRYTPNRLRWWFCKKQKQLDRASRTTQMSISTKSWDSSDCLCFRKTFHGRKHEVLSESRMRLAVHVRFDEWDVKTEHGPDNETPADERAGYR